MKLVDNSRGHHTNGCKSRNDDMVRQNTLFGALAAVCLSAAALCPTPSDAAVLLFEATSVIQTPGDSADLQLTPSTFPTIVLALNDAAVSAGAFLYNRTANPTVVSGDVADFVAFTIGDFITVTTEGMDPAAFSADLTFSSDGAVTRGSISYSSERFQIGFSGNAAAFSGSFRPSPLSNCGDCQASGTLITIGFSSVPEPASAVLLVPLMAGLGVLRRRQVRKTTSTALG